MRHFFGASKMRRFFGALINDKHLPTGGQISQIIFQ
jgi:hypothetical protein